MFFFLTIASGTSEFVSICKDDHKNISIIIYPVPGTFHTFTLMFNQLSESIITVIIILWNKILEAKAWVAQRFVPRIFILPITSDCLLLFAFEVVLPQPWLSVEYNLSSCVLPGSLLSPVTGTRVL